MLLATAQRLGKTAYLAGIFLLFALLHRGGFSKKTLLLLSLGLGSVLVEQLEGLGGGVAIQSMLELCNGRGDLQSEVEDFLLALKTDILGPPEQ